MTRPPRWATAVFAVALAVFGIAQAVYVFAGEATYRDLLPGGSVDVHRQTLAYVLGDAAEPAPLFDPSERSHLADVRGVFAGLRVAWVVAALAIVALLISARGHRLRLVRDGALWAGAGALVIAVVAALAFEPAFLAFHYLFFPQGNFLFDPATSSLLRVYPQSYWYGVTLRVGATFIVAMALIAGASSLLARRRAAR